MNTRLRPRSWSILGAGCALAVLVAGCAPANGESPNGATLTGSVTFAEAPVPGAHIQLRAADWHTNPDSVVAETVANTVGQFEFDQPPAGEYVVIGVFPDGEEDEGGWPVINVQPDQRISDFVIPLERHLNLGGPAPDVLVTEQPVLTWDSFAGAAEYRVWVIDAGTTEVLMDQMTTDLQLSVTLELTTGATYRWVVNALSADGCVLASGAREFTYSESAGS